MIFISHRGNTNGINKKFENNPAYIKSAINNGYNVEIDVWYKNAFFLGHDGPKFKVSQKFLENKKLWCHAKNLEALEKLQKIKTKYFWHQEDDYTLTSNGYIWTYPGKKLSKKSICVLPELHKKKLTTSISGICSDFIEKYKKLYD
tara:strand:- start:39 stop:476 length:438 start_codon:yes stop_codon:yes gene_type:complete